MKLVPSLVPPFLNDWRLSYQTLAENKVEFTTHSLRIAFTTAIFFATLKNKSALYFSSGFSFPATLIAGGGCLIKYAIEQSLWGTFKEKCIGIVAFYIGWQAWDNYRAFSMPTLEKQTAQLLCEKFAQGKLSEELIPSCAPQFFKHLTTYYKVLRLGFFAPSNRDEAIAFLATIYRIALGTIAFIAVPYFPLNALAISYNLSAPATIICTGGLLIKWGGERIFSDSLKIKYLGIFSIYAGWKIWDYYLDYSSGLFEQYADKIVPFTYAFLYYKLYGPRT